MTWRQAEQQKSLYSFTYVVRNSSGSSTYEFPDSQETCFFARVEVPSKQGCAGWRFGAMTN